MRTERQSLPRERHWICARRLRERRVALGLTQLEVAQALRRQGLDLGNRALSAMEHGHALDVGWLPELSAALDCTTTYLLGMTEDPHGWQPAPNPTPPATSIAEATDPTDPAVLGTTVPGPATSDDVGAERCGWILGPNVPDRNPAGG
jgi:transcriptional regulator with XRE-family HTH domain